MIDWFRGRRPWAQLDRIITGLPAHSRYGAALIDNPDVITELLEQEDQDPAGDMSLVGFDPVRSLLTALIDAVNNNTAAVIAAAGADPPDIPPAPRPVTELDRARARQRHTTRQSLADLAMGRTADN